MNNKRHIKILLLLAGVIVFALIIWIIVMTGFKKKKQFYVGFIMTGTTTEQGWNKLHYDGIKEACEQLDAELFVKENIKENEGQCKQAVNELAEDKVDTYWIGIEQDAVGLTEYSPKVTQATITIIEEAKQEIMNGYDVFSGIIYDTEHTFRCDEGETIDDEQLLKYLDWYVEGVEFYEE